MNIIINYYIVSSVCLSVSSVLSDYSVPGPLVTVVSLVSLVSSVTAVSPVFQ